MVHCWHPLDRVGCVVLVAFDLQGSGPAVVVVCWPVPVGGVGQGEIFVLFRSHGAPTMINNTPEYEVLRSNKQADIGSGDQDRPAAVQTYQLERRSRAEAPSGWGRGDYPKHVAFGRRRRCDK